MSLGAAIAISSALSAGSSYMGYKAQREQASKNKRAAKREAEFIRKRNRLEQRIAIEKFELETGMKKERSEFETDYKIGQSEKKEARTIAQAIAGYATSGVGGKSSEAVLDRIEGEFELEQETIQEAADMELEQFTTSSQQSLDWFLEQSTLETEYGVQSSLSAAQGYGSQADAAEMGMVLGPLAAGTSGYATNEMMKLQ